VSLPGLCINGSKLQCQSRFSWQWIGKKALPFSGQSSDVILQVSVHIKAGRICDPTLQSTTVITLKEI
jgi:hypothetical protein